ncbi:MAG: hypothetical protein ACN6RJ_02640 [Stenotrophomonas sp.]
MMGRNHESNNQPVFDIDWRQATLALPILIVERSQASVMSTDALIAAAKTGLKDACENYRTALIEHRRA